MTYRNLLYYEGIRGCHENKLHENKHENHINPLHTFRFITWSQLIVSGRTKRWPPTLANSPFNGMYCHIQPKKILNGGSRQDCGGVKKTSCSSSSLYTK